MSPIISPASLPANPEQDPTVCLTRDMIRIPSVTAIAEEDPVYSRQSLDIAAAYATAAGATTKRMEFSGEHIKWGYVVDNLYIEWQFGKAHKEQKHLCYIGHTDVVPIGDESRWTSPPFHGAIQGGYLYGRGATDMKGSIAAFLTAIAEVRPRLSAGNGLKVSMILTTDEEWAAVNGTRKVLKWMKEKDIAPDAFLVGEPSSQDTLGSHIKIGRRGSLVGNLIAQGVQGHAAYQELFENPNRSLALAATILNSHPWKDGNKNFPNTNFEVIATQSGDFNASAIVPRTARMMWNIRYTPQQTPESLTRWIVKSLAEPPVWARAHPDFERLKKIEVKPNIDVASLPYATEPGHLAASAQKAIQEILGITPKIDGSGGTTDGRFAAKIFPKAEIIELGLPERGGMAHGVKDERYLREGGMHQVNERAAVADLIQLRRIYAATLEHYGR